MREWLAFPLAISLAFAGARCARARPAIDSILAERNLVAIFAPIDTIHYSMISECSGIAILDDSWFVHNDSGDDATLYRSSALDFVNVEVLPLPGARAVDWEDITVWEGDLLVADIGDNQRRRTEVVLYRAHYEPGTPRGQLRLVGTYPFRYPDGRHDAEALAVVDGTVTVIIKDRGDGFTGVYQFDHLTDRAQLAPGIVNEPKLIGRLALEEGEQVTAADYDAGSRTLAVLTYDRILCWPAGHLDGPPARAVRLSARQCEALCFDGDRLVIANEQREVFAIDRFLQRGYRSLVPAEDSR